MQLTQSSSARGLLLVAAISLVVAACGSGGGATDQGASQAPATTDPPATTSADPLQGDWRTEYTCQQKVRAIRARLSAKEVLELVGSWKSFIGEEFGGKPTEDDPCHGATETPAFLARFADGNLALCDASGGCPVHATYELVGDHSIVVNDPENNICAPCPGTWDFEIAGDRLTFHVEPDPSIIGGWEAAPWTRES